MPINQHQLINRDIMLFFVDGCCQQQGICYGWYKQGEHDEIKTNGIRLGGIIECSCFC